MAVMRSPTRCHYRFIILVSLLAGVCVTEALQEQPQILRFTDTPPQQIQQWQPWEACFEPPPGSMKGVTNPYEASQVLVQGSFSGPSNRLEVVDGFWYQNYTRALVQNIEQLTAVGAPMWCVRYTPRVLGSYSFKVTLSVHMGQPTGIGSGSFDCTLSTEGMGGFAKVGPNQQSFVDDVGTSVWLLGENVAWTNASGTFAWDTYFNRISSNGGNYARLWLTNAYLGDLLAIQTTSGVYNMENSWRLDQVVTTAQSLKMRLMMCTESFNLLCINTTAFCVWQKSPFNTANGGVLDTPSQFFTSPEQRTLYKRRLRYLVSRYSWATSVLAWEYFNEVDITQGFNQTIVADWASEMSTYLRSIDIYQHPISTSFSYPLGHPAVDKLPALDFTMTHTYGSEDMVKNTIEYNTFKFAAYRKPTFVAEFGNGEGYKPDQPKGMEDPTGIYLHNGYWGGIVSPGTGGCMSWWWDSFIDPAHVYWRYNGVSKFSAIVPWSAHNWMSAPVTSCEPWRAQVLAGVAVGGSTQFQVATVLVQNTNFTWYKVAHGAELNAIEKVQLTVPGCSPTAKYLVSWYNTTTGDGINSDVSQCSSSSNLSVTVPDFTQDVAAFVAQV